MDVSTVNVSTTRESTPSTHGGSDLKAAVSSSAEMIQMVAAHGWRGGEVESWNELTTAGAIPDPLRLSRRAILKSLMMR